MTSHTESVSQVVCPPELRIEPEPSGPMTDLDMFHAFLTQTGIVGHERPRRVWAHRDGLQVEVDAPGTTIVIDDESGDPRWDGYAFFCFAVTFDADGKLVTYGAFEALGDG